MAGGLGNDLYSIENVADVVIETSTLATEIDQINSFVSYTLGANVENLSLTGSAVINGTGNALNNKLTGNAAANVLTGGLGVDTFKFNTVIETGITATTRDTISDFNHAQADKIDLSVIDANLVLAGNQAFSFIGTAAFSSTNAAGQLRFDAVNHLVYGSNDADSSPEFSILLTGVTSLVATDFIL
jgi:serralysin